jgi:hypothetical protein
LTGGLPEKAFWQKYHKNTADLQKKAKKKQKK